MKYLAAIVIGFLVGAGIVTLFVYFAPKASHF